MITITTINNSWYFLGDLVIKPNSSSTYQEENLSKNQAKDLLESVSSKRVSLSPEDLIKVQNRYNSFNSGGNVDLSGVISKIENIYKDDGGGVRSGVLVDEIDERIAADLDITEALNHKASLGVDGKILSEQIPNITDISGNSATSSKLQTPVNIEISGDATSSPVSFDGSANISLSVTLGNTGVSSGTYNNSPTAITPLTIDSKGRITGTGSAVTITPAWSSISSKPTTISGYGITDAYTKTEVDTVISGISGSGGAIPRPKFVGGTRRYLVNVWHDYNFGWVPEHKGSVFPLLAAGKTWLYPFIPLEDCVVSHLGVHTGAGYAGNIKLGFYDSNSSAKPNNKLFGSSLINTAVGYTLLPVSTGGISVTAGNLYWIALFSQDGGSPQLVQIQNLYPMVSSGDAYQENSTVYGYVINQNGLTPQKDLPIFPAAEPFMTYAKSNTAPRIVFKISS